MKTDVSLKEYTTFQIGGKASYFIEVQDKDELMDALRWAKQEKMPFFVLGGGSNLLIPDSGFDGLAIKIKNQKLKITNGKQKDKMIVEAGAGFLLGQLVELSMEHGLSGMEWSAGIPRANLGGATYMNAGGFGQHIADLIEEVEVLDSNDLTIKRFSFNQCQFGYKESIFKHQPNLIVLSVVLSLEKREKSEVIEEVKRVLSYRRESHPNYPSAGCIFKNPPELSAGELIKKSGLAGKQIGQAQISEKHCNFIVNLGNAKAGDVKELIELAKKQVKEKYKIELQEEVQYL